MIEINIKTDGNDVLDSLNDKNCTLKEVAVCLLRLKQIEQILIDKDFESKFELREDDGGVK